MRLFNLNTTPAVRKITTMGPSVWYATRDLATNAIAPVPPTVGLCFRPCIRALGTICRTPYKREPRQTLLFCAWVF